MTNINEAVATLLPTLAGRQATVVKGDPKASKSAGYHASGKVHHDGHTYQVSIGAWLIKSKETGEKLKAADAADVVTQVGTIVAQLAPKAFTSGKAGYFGQGKVVIDGQRFQTQAQAVRLT